MWNLAKGNEFLSSISLRRLQIMYDKETHAKAKLRLLSAIHRKKGKSIDEIAYLLSKSRRTIHGWLTRFQERGIVGKDSIKQSGRPATITLLQRKKLSKVARDHLQSEIGGILANARVTRTKLQSFLMLSVAFQSLSPHISAS